MSVVVGLAKVARTAGWVLFIFVVAAFVGTSLAGCDDGPVDGSPCTQHELARTATNRAGDVLECVADPDVIGSYTWARIGKGN